MKQFLHALFYCNGLALVMCINQLLTENISYILTVGILWDKMHDFCCSNSFQI